VIRIKYYPVIAGIIATWRQEMKLKVDALSFAYDDTQILFDVNLEMNQGEVTGIVGPNGSGKTTLIRCINRILTPKQGLVMLDERDVSTMNRNEMAQKMSLVPQDNSRDPCSPTVYEVVLMGRRPYISWNFGEKDRELTWAAMKEMAVDDLAMRPFDRLSSGQAQRVLIARSIAQEAKVLLLDEPTSNLDVRYQLEVLKTISETVRRRQICACIIIHDLDLAMHFCNRTVMLRNGRVVANGLTAEVLTAENIEQTYGIKCVICHEYGRARILID